MRTTLKKWGNSASVRIPASVMEAAHLRLDQTVDVREEKGRVVIEPAERREYRIEDLVRGITRKNRHDEIDAGGPLGKEAWQVAAYVPEAGDVVWLQFSPQAGHEQAGLRPALVLSPSSYNSRSGLMVCCPLTTRIKGYPFEVAVAGDTPAVVLADQVKSLDWRARRAKRKGRVDAVELAEVRSKLRALIG